MDSATEGAGGQGSCIEAPCRSGVCSTKLQDKLEVAATVSLLLLNNHGGVGDVGAPSLAPWWSGKLVLWRNQSLDSRGQDSGARLASGAVSEVALANKRRRDASEMVFPNPSCPVGLAGTLHFFSQSAPRRPKGPVIGADLGRRARRALSRATTPQGEVVGVNPWESIPPCRAVSHEGHPPASRPAPECEGTTDPPVSMPISRPVPSKESWLGGCL